MPLYHPYWLRNIIHNFLFQNHVYLCGLFVVSSSDVQNIFALYPSVPPPPHVAICLSVFILCKYCSQLL